jgi:hypothetical protein
VYRLALDGSVASASTVIVLPSGSRSEIEPLVWALAGSPWSATHRAAPIAAATRARARNEFSVNLGLKVWPVL